MRPGQNTKRMRGRPNNRKGPNPLTRTYESSGPDVKIRGTAHHIGEKYLQLARDAQSAGDPVMAESYLQHAEHYFRLIAMAQQAQSQSAIGYPRLAGDTMAEEFDEGDDFAAIPDRFSSPTERFAAAPQPAYVPQPQPQPMPQGYDKPYYGGAERPTFDRPERPMRAERNFPEKSYPDRTLPERGQGRELEGRSHRGGRSGRDVRSDSQPRADRLDLRAPADDIESKGLPAFITVPVRPPAEPIDEGTSSVETVPPALAEQPEVEREVNGYHLRPRRRRRTKAEMVLDQGPSSAESDARDPVGD
jgi:hypothetical protein